MSVTQLSDLVIVHAVFNAGMVLESLDLDAFVRSGVMIRDAEMDAFLAGPVGGRTFNPRFMGPLPDDDPNISSDNPAAKSTPGKISAVKNTAVRQSLNKSWSSMDLTADLNGADPVAAIQSQIAKYWLTVRQKRMLASLKGVIADSVANHASDMVIDVSAGAGAASLISANAIIDACATMGDHDGVLRGITVHSVVLATMRKLNIVDTIPLSESNITIQSYMGKPILVDDGMTFSGGNFYSYLFGAGAVALGVGSAKVPFEIDRTPEAGNGGGQETVYSREELMIHPQGYECALTDTPTMAQLEAETSWNRAWERKRIPLAAIITKG